MNTNLLRGKIVENGMTQAELAKLIGMSENSLSRKLLGKREFRLSEAIDICNVLKIDNPKEIFFDRTVPNMQLNEEKRIR